MKNGRFLIGLVGVATVVTFLVWTGVSESMIYFVTPVELMERVEADPTFKNVGVKVGGKVLPGSYVDVQGELLHKFRVMDMDDPSVHFAVEYADVLPDTFSEDVDVVVEGRFDENDVFQATVVLAKCGSRYEAAPEAMRTAG